MRSIARAYVTKRECSVQEAVYLVMPELWLRKSFPGKVFANEQDLKADNSGMYTEKLNEVGIIDIILLANKYLKLLVIL